MAAPAFNLTPLDHQLLAMTDEEFAYHDWNELKDIIGRSDSSKFLPAQFPSSVLLYHSPK